MSEISTLQGTINWANQVKFGNQGSEVPLLFLVGTKADTLAPSVRTFVEQEANKIARDLSAEYWTVSSQTGENVDNLFNRVAALSFDCVVKSIVLRLEEEKKNKTVQYHENFVKLNKRRKLAAIKSCFLGKCWPKSSTHH